MENTLKTLNYISTKIDLNLFYSMNIYKNEIRFQGHKNKRKEVNPHFKIVNKLDYNGWFNHDSVIDNVSIHITLT